MYSSGRLLENMLILCIANLHFVSVDWNSKIVSKYEMLDFDTEEISSLENICPHKGVSMQFSQRAVMALILY